jgi:hypothetical protein
MGSLKQRASGGPIKWPAMNLTLISGTTISIGAILTVWHESFKKVFGYAPMDHPGASAAIFAALVIALGLIFAADMLARGIASSKVGSVVAMPDGWKATVIASGEDEKECDVAAARTTAAGLEYFVIAKKDGSGTWRDPGTKAGQVTLQPPS